MRLARLTTILALATTSVAAADTVKVSPATARPGDAVLVTVTGGKEMPKGDAAGVPLQFFKAKNGYQAVFAVPLVTKEEAISVEVTTAKKPARVKVKQHAFPETDVVVEEEMANPPPAERKQIDADNQAMIAALTKDGDAEFTRGFVRPTGGVSSVFGEWRTFNDGHRSQHLGFDVFAKEGQAVKAINAGTVTLVRDTFLAGKVIVVSHGRGIGSAYFHLSAADVAEGATVAAGDVIGKAGATGRTTGPHLHLAVRVPNGFVDPASFFKLGVTPAAKKVDKTARR